MKAIELRIGNWVLWTGNKRQIEALDINDLEEHQRTSKIIMVEPIPLTEQWCKDFKLTLKIWNNTLNDYQIKFMRGYSISLQFGLYKNHNGLCQVRLYPIQSNTIIVLWDWYWAKEKEYHVHTLQNLYFGLTGKELIKIK